MDVPLLHTTLVEAAKKGIFAFQIEKTMRRRSIVLFFTLLCAILLEAQETEKEINLSGNAYVTENFEGASITDQGLQKWSDEHSVIKTFVYFSEPQTVKIKVRGNAPEKSTFSVDFSDRKKKVKVREGDFDKKLGKFRIKSPGYYAFSLQGDKKSEDRFADISSLVIESADTAMVYVHDFSDYWGRRGPSVHLSFPMPDDTIEWLYNEVTVPEGNDVIGSYYMANGFGEGYFGMQCNSKTERRVLFSVWSPFDTQDPKLIPDSLRIKLLRRGEGVNIGEFGNEGSGGQSFLRYNWKAGNTYKFLTRIHPDGQGNTIYTAYFYATDENRWRLIAGFLRPETNVYYTRAHSFLENFIPGQGYLTREVYFGNQWFRTKSGKWIEGTQARFSHDATAGAGVRLDYQGGYDENRNLFSSVIVAFFMNPRSLEPLLGVNRKTFPR